MERWTRSVLGNSRNNWEAVLLAVIDETLGLVSVSSTRDSRSRYSNGKFPTLGPSLGIGEEKLRNVIQAAQSLHHWTPQRLSDTASSDSTVKKSPTAFNLLSRKLASVYLYCTKSDQSHSLI
jgi:hypothetical protein